MKYRKTLLIGQGNLLLESVLEDVTVTRISPRSYYAGEKSGFIVGITIGLVFGIMLSCLFVGIYL